MAAVNWSPLLAVALLCGCTFSGSVGGSYSGRVAPSEYRPSSDLILLLRGLSPPPLRLVTSPGVPPPIVNWGPLLAWANAAPGAGSITRADLQRLTLPFLAWGATNPTPGNPQINTPQAAALGAAVRSLLQPRGLWNAQTLAYLRSQGSQLVAILLRLRAGLLATATPGSFSLVGVSQARVLQTLANLRGADRLTVAAALPGLIRALTAHEGYDPPLTIVYGSKRDRHGVGLQLSKQGRTYSLNKRGLLLHSNTVGPAAYWQGEDDITLTYLQVSVRGRRVVVEGTHASDRFALARLSVGGSTDTLSYTQAFSASMAAVEANAGPVTGRVLYGLTPLAQYAGATVSVTYGSGVFAGRAGTGVLYESTGEVFSYWDTVNTLRTPYLEFEGDGGEAQLWLSATASLAALGHEGGWQGDARLTLAGHIRVAAPAFSLSLSAGQMLAVVPGGHTDLGAPARSLSLYPIRSHALLTLEIPIAEQAAVGVGGAVEVSRATRRWRIEPYALVSKVRVGIPIRSLRERLTLLGGSLSYGPFSAEALTAVTGSGYLLSCSLVFSW